jgi:hypothetical protein
MGGYHFSDFIDLFCGIDLTPIPDLIVHTPCLPHGLPERKHFFLSHQITFPRVSEGIRIIVFSP